MRSHLEIELKSSSRPYRGKAENDTASRESTCSTGNAVNFLDDFFLLLVSVHHRRDALHLSAFNRLKSHLLPAPVPVCNFVRCFTALLRSVPPVLVVVGWLFQPRRIVRRQNGARCDVISDAFANNARSLRFAVVIRGVI